ncbi:hypothetical protein [Oryza sativa Japonica Group]|uniref:Uncharacterized protein n=1 Tax=Oryza sativa subsp. japonica TaxID=39947 RepID=Q5JMV3_ORYSJ|nr:hypothetical protein [Oryza sativa Japonica Group]
MSVSLLQTDLSFSPIKPAPSPLVSSSPRPNHPRHCCQPPAACPRDCLLAAALCQWPREPRRRPRQARCRTAVAKSVCMHTSSFRPRCFPPLPGRALSVPRLPAVATASSRLPLRRQRRSSLAGELPTVFLLLPHNAPRASPLLCFSRRAQSRAVVGPQLIDHPHQHRP